ncbi:ABC transporter family substrate-binding protein [Trueperella bialowiezensis]|uniref:Oligopeptide-binding protein AppA n=1 Tax=Trueperella bialowiezensis TaxID=312285 RepID=A0A448PDD8_9ACTO|nr:ABC transporter family substrate-binding protein [Trueperella bialowiezensis]VEI12951.1 Oligopeptide-binding protein AppA precursor [Trueperella bialowiezensis]
MQLKKASIALLAAAALALSACSTGGSNKGDGGDGGSDLPASDYNKVDPAELQDGGKLSLTIGAYPENWNRWHLDGNTVDLASKIGSFVNPVNWIYDENGNFDVNPNYVESYTMNDKGDGESAMILTMNLNPNAKWNSGTPITYADYEATWKACSGQIEDVTCPSPDGWNEIESIEKGENEFQVVVKYNTVYPDWSANMSEIGPAEGLSDAATFNEGWKDAVESAKYMAGPFIPTNSNTAQGVLTLERNPNWWGPTPKLDTVTFSALEQEPAAAAFANSEIDALNFIVDAASYETANKRQDVDIKMSSSVQWRHFTFNSRAGVLQDKLVRQGIQHAIDTADIAASDLAGLPSAELNLHLGNHFFMPNQDGYVDNSVEFSEELAKEKFEEAGYVMNESTGYYEKDGQELAFRYLRLPGNHASENEGAMLTEQMQKVGVRVTYTDTEPKDFFTQIQNGEYESTSFAWQGTPYPMANVGQIYGKPLDDEGRQLNSNFTGLEVPEIDALIPQIASETDDAKRRELTNEADKLVWDNVMVLPLYYRANITAIPSNLANYGSTAFETLLVENIGYIK